MAKEQARSTLVDLPAAPEADATVEGAFLIEIYGRQLGRRIDLTTQDLVLGRDASCQVPLDDHTVSRTHAAFRWVEGRHVVVDLGSTNGTYVNNAPVSTQSIVHGDLVKVGQSIFRYVRGGTTEAQYHEVIYRLMTRDGLTEALNRRAFDASLEREISRARRYRRPLGLITFDVDHFKRVNDEHGHMAGDEALRQLAAVVQRGVRQEDVFARVGGEEFALLVPEGTREGCRQMAERLRVLIEQDEFEFGDQRVTITCSFGVAVLDPEADDPGERMRKEADDRLYAAKRAGRNRVEA